MKRLLEKVDIQLRYVVRCSDFLEKKQPLRSNGTCIIVIEFV